MKPQGLNAKLIEDNLELTLEDAVSEEYLVLPALELAEALARLEEKPPLFVEGVSDESEGGVKEPQISERLLAPWQPPFPGEAEEMQEGYRAAEIAMIDPPEMLLLRRLFIQGEDLLEFDTPSGSVYEFPYSEALSYLKDFLPR